MSIIHDVLAAMDSALDVTPNAVNWADIPNGASPQNNADQTINGINTSITLRATLSSGTYDAGGKSFIVYKNSVNVGSVTPSNGATLDVTVVNGDTVHYEGTKGGTPGTAWNATATVTNVTDSSATLDTFLIVTVSAP